MSRLTVRAEEDGVKAVWYGERDVFLEGEIGYAEADKLAHYEDLEEQDRMIKLPCAVGDKVYLFANNTIYPFAVNGFEINKYEVEFRGLYCGKEKSLEHWIIRFPVSRIGKNVFLTPEAAEAKLSEMEGAE